MEKLEQIKSLCDLMTDTKCEIDWQEKRANIDFMCSDSRFRVMVSNDNAEYDLEDELEKARIMIKDYESIVMKLEALLLLKVLKEDKE